MNVMISWSLFIFYCFPFDPEVTWSTQNHQENFNKWIQIESVEVKTEDGGSKYYIYEDDWHYSNNKEKVNRTLLLKILDDKKEADAWVNVRKLLYLSNPELIYHERWLDYDLH